MKSNFFFRCHPIIILLLYFSLCLANAESGAKTTVSNANNYIDVNVAIPREFPPHYSLDENGELTGFAIDVFNRVAEIAKINKTYLVKESWKAVYQSIDSKEADVIPNLGISSGRLNKYSFTAPTEVSPISIAVRKSNNDIDNVNDLSNKKVAVVEGNVGVKLMEEYPESYVNIYPSIQRALFSLLSGDVDAIVYPQYVLIHIIQSIDADAKIKFVGPTLLEVKRAIAVNKDKKELLDRLNTALSKFKKTNEYNSLYIKWHAKLKPYWTVKRIIIVMVMIIVFLTAIMSYWRYKTVKKINEKLIDSLNTLDKHVIFLKTDLKGIITHASDAFSRLSEFPKGELIGQSHNIIRHPDMPDSVFRNILKVIQQKESITVEIKNRKKNGGYYWAEATIEADFNAKGKHIGYISTRFEITDKKEVVFLQNEITKTQREVVFKMGAIGEIRSKETGYHVRRVAEYSKILALYSGLNEEEAELIKQASPMHDIGKVGIPDSILNKPGKLDAREWKIMQTHAQLGYDMLSDSTRPLLKTAAIVAYEHHEKFDGTGYPQALKGENIHIYGRITALADVFDALGSDRCYKKAWSDEQIFSLFNDERAKHFDPKLVDIFFSHLDEFLAIRDKFRDPIT